MIRFDPAGWKRLAGLVRLFVRFRPFVRRYRMRLYRAAAWMICGILAGLMAPWPIQIVIDGVLLGKRDSGALSWFGDWLPTGQNALLLTCCIAVVSIAAIQGFCSYRQRMLATRVGHRIVADMRSAVFAKLQRLSLSFHAQRGTGDLLMRLTGDITLLRSILVPAVLDSASRVLVLIGMLTLMALMDPGLTLIAVATLPLLALATLRFGKKIRGVVRRQRRKEGKIAAVAADALRSISMVQAFSREEEVAAQFAARNKRSTREGLKAVRLAESLSRIVEVTLALSTALVMWIGVQRAVSGTLSPGELIVFLTYLRSLYKPVQALVRTSSRANKAIACGERVWEVLEAEEEVRDLPDAIDAPALSGEIVFDRVTFGYDPQRPVLHEVSLRIRPGEKVALVGPSGSGKSTILALLLRLYEPQSGRILVDGQDIRTFTLESYRRQLAVVMQEPFLFGASVRENILQGLPGASDEQIEDAAHRAGAAEFVEALPDGYNTVLDEGGASLSRGQRQRIALGRAMLRDAPIAIFDEPTTGLDLKTEAGVLRTLSQMAEHRTSIWIAHARNQILDCPRVIVIRKGHLIQDGSPATLLERAGSLDQLFGGIS